MKLIITIRGHVGATISTTVFAPQDCLRIFVVTCAFHSQINGNISEMTYLQWNTNRKGICEVLNTNNDPELLTVEIQKALTHLLQLYWHRK